MTFVQFVCLFWITMGFLSIYRAYRANENQFHLSYNLILGIIFVILGITILLLGFWAITINPWPDFWILIIVTSSFAYRTGADLFLQFRPRKNIERRINSRTFTLSKEITLALFFVLIIFGGYLITSFFVFKLQGLEIFDVIKIFLVLCLGAGMVILIRWLRYSGHL